MAPFYVMSLEDRVDLARNQLDAVIGKLRRAAAGQSGAGEVTQVVHSATAELQHISDLIGR